MISPTVSLMIQNVVSCLWIEVHVYQLRSGRRDRISVSDKPFRQHDKNCGTVVDFFHTNFLRYLAHFIVKMLNFEFVPKTSSVGGTI